MSAQLSSVFGDWLSQFEWQFFGTFTFEMPRKCSGIPVVARWWDKTAARAASVPISAHAHAFIADEYDRDCERLHVHALLYAEPKPLQDRLWGSWRRYWGRERILRFDQKLGAAWYCAKYLMKDEQMRGDWRFVEWDEGLVSDGSDIRISVPDCPYIEREK